MYILSGTLYVITGLLVLLALFLWKYFQWYYCIPLLIFGIIFILLGLSCYSLEYLRNRRIK